jgi:hypothetical protein
MALADRPHKKTTWLGSPLRSRRSNAVDKIVLLFRTKCMAND